MALNIATHNGAQARLDRIRTIAEHRRDALDDFFWLRMRHDGDQLRFSRGDTSAKTKDSYRIANIVLQGGGVLGLAHAGFVTGLEAIGVRFIGIAGTSAGSIAAMGMAAVRGDQLQRETGPENIRIVSRMPMEFFIDGPYRVRRLIKAILARRRFLDPWHWMAWLNLASQLIRRRGLNPGHEFEDWLKNTLRDFGLTSVDDLNATLTRLAGMLTNGAAERLTSSGAPFGVPVDCEALAGSLLQIMAACSPLGVKFRFPRDADVLAPSIMQNSPAALVRASMAIPFFFEPARFDVNSKRWPDFVSERLGKLVTADLLRDFSNLESVSFLDGGLFSNLPVDAFVDTMADVPTIAVPLVSSKNARAEPVRSKWKRLAGDIGTTAYMVRNHRDRDALEALNARRTRFNIRRARASVEEQALMPPVFPYGVAPIDTGEANWLDFLMDDAAKMDLVIAGLAAAEKFLTDI